jgi:hypothetical protein
MLILSTMDGEKRDVTIDHINKKIDQAIEVCRKYPKCQTH